MNDYYDDEIDPYEEYALDEYDIYDERYIESHTERSHHAWVYKAANGHLAYHQFELVKYPWMDWGEAVVENERWLRLNEMNLPARANALEIGRKLKNGQSLEWGWCVCLNCGGPLNENGECFEDDCVWEPPF